VARILSVTGIVVLLLGVSYAGIGAPRAPRIVTFSSGLPPGGGSASVNLTVNLTDSPSFEPSSLKAPPNAVLHLHLKNTGVLNHTFTISTKANFVVPTNWTPTQLDAFFTTNGSIVNISVPAGSTIFTNVSLPGYAVTGESFEIVSVLPYQFQAGMRGFLNVSVGTLGPGVVLDVQATDTFRFVPDALAVNATSYPVTVDVDATNIGVLPHTWTLVAQPNYTLLASNYSTYLQAHPPLGRASLANGGESNWTNFSVAAPGVYEFICEITGHFLNGMFGFLYVGVAPPANATPPSTAIVQVGILVGAASLLGIGAIFALAASYTGRFPRTPPSGGHTP